MTVPFCRAIGFLGLAALAGCARTAPWGPPQPISTQETPAIAAVPAESAKRRPSDPEAVRAVRELLDSQVAAWNRHDLDGFLAGYRQDEHVVFTTPGDSSRGFAELQQRYRKSYNAPEKFGVLAFGEVEIEPVDSTSMVARGTWRLDRA